ncbi:hypothetical protein MPLDJ20_110252 [Mesorhizobium plurifarium]|uniref:GIY-YIG domain-containing protein n=1 Tax=Mesorhizobium plurifarium TaxID=69974 RepID=A0A090DS15_MESPL|nr:hypothetical protein MPLDJ20_110252 [Mesorhizobium plurifarium]
MYMTASQKGGTIYIGVTSDLARRMPEHKNGQGSRFTSRYGAQRLVCYEEYFDIGRCHTARKIVKALAAPMEDRTDREDQSRMVRALSRDGLVSDPHRRGARMSRHGS